jgi:hypothetical protein
LTAFSVYDPNLPSIPGGPNKFPYPRCAKSLCNSVTFDPVEPTVPPLPIRNVCEFGSQEVGVGVGYGVRGIICGLPIPYSSTKNPRHVSTTLPETVSVI